MGSNRSASFLVSSAFLRLSSRTVLFYGLLPQPSLDGFTLQFPDGVGTDPSGGFGADLLDNGKEMDSSAVGFSENIRNSTGICKSILFVESV